MAEKVLIKLAKTELIKEEHLKHGFHKCLGCFLLKNSLFLCLFYEITGSLFFNN